MADVVLKRHCKLLSFFTIITIHDEARLMSNNQQSRPVVTL